MVRGWFSCRGRNTNKEKNHQSQSSYEEKKFHIRFYQFNTLRIATNNFSTLLGIGGFGSVYKGVLPNDGRTVAIKRLQVPYEGFLEMVEVMSNLRHINLIQVLGCCVEGTSQLLVCEYAENGNVSDRLHGKNRPVFDWETRAAVCIGAARGISYLHDEINPRVIHRDIKPSNILLDSNLVPKIADFDLVDFVDGRDTSSVGERGTKRYMAPRRPGDMTSINTHVQGTCGYMDPIYMLMGKYTEKVDVYSFGVVMLEIITGRTAIEFAKERKQDRMILDWVTRVIKDGVVLQIVDPKLIDFPRGDAERFINVALLCTLVTPEQRPSMFEVVHMLYGRFKSDHEISEMAAKALAAQAARSMSWLHAAVSMSSLKISRSIKASIGIDCAANPDETSNKKDVSGSRGECSSKATRAPAADNSGKEDMVRMYFVRSMEYQVEMLRRSNRTTIMTQATSIRSSEHVFMEAVYPPFQSGKYRLSRLLRSERAAPL